MDNSNMSFNTKISEALEALALIVLLYSIFLGILGIVIKNTELILQTCIMFVVYFIFEYLNSDTTLITSKGIKNKKIGNIEWKDVYRVEKKRNNIFLYTKLRKKAYKVALSKAESRKQMEKIYRYMLSKIKDPERIK